MRDRASAERDADIKYHVWAREQRQAADEHHRATAQAHQDAAQPEPNPESTANLLEQTAIDQEVRASEQQNDDARLLALLHDVDVDRRTATEDRRAAQRNRQEAASDRRWAAEERLVTAAEQEQAEIERNQEPFP